MSAVWTTRPFLSIDTETTGVDPWSDHLVEVAAVTIAPDGSVADSWSTVVDPGVEIPDEASNIHGITTERARAEGVEPGAALTSLAALIRLHLPDPIVIYNARFDWPLLLTQADLYGVDFPPAAPILDPYLLDRMVDRYRKGKRQLAVVAQHYGVDLSGDDAHGAAADARASGQIMRALIAAHPKIGDHTLAGVQLRQVRGAEDDRLRFVDYMRRQVDPTFDSPPGWPIPGAAA